MSELKREDLQKKTVKDLQALLEEKELPTKGKKTELIARLLGEEPEKEEKTKPEKRKAEPKEKKSAKKKKTEDEEDEEGEEGEGEGGEEKNDGHVEDTTVPYGPIKGKVKIVSFNVNGFSAAAKKGLKEYVAKEKPDILCLQETKFSDKKSESNFFGSDYHSYNCNCSSQKNYAGTAVYTKIKPLNVIEGIKNDTEGRVLTLEFDNFYLVNTYVPNSGMKLERLEYRQGWDKDMLALLKDLEKKKPVLWTGDLNVAHNEIDLAIPEKRKNKVPGFCDEEREGFSNVLNSGFVDIFRSRNPKKVAYTFWSYKFNSRQKNAGWRLDYWVASKDLASKLGTDFIRNSVYGASDHCPIGILIDDWRKETKENEKEKEKEKESKESKEEN